MRTIGVIYFATFIVGCGSLTRYISHIQNYVNLVSAYNLDGYSTIDFPPLADVSQAIVVNIDMHLYAVNGFDEVAGNIELVVALEMDWLDEMSIIQSITFKIEDRAEFLVPFDMIWTPKIVLTNAIGATSDVGDSAYLCRFDMNTKRISWKPRVVVSGSCTPDVTYYPFDKQECDFIYTAWGFKSDEIMLQTSTDAWNLGEYGESGEWDIDSTSTVTYIQNGQSYILFKIVMVRKPLYFAFNILLPILVLCLLNSTVFLLPAESGERVGFSVTCFLSFMVLLNMIMDIMPRSSNPISFLCYYLVVMMSNSGAMTLVTILLMRVYHKPEKSEVPKWMQRAVTFVNCGCAKLRCCVLCCRYLRKKCCCEDQRKCGCNKKKKTISEESLVEITIDKDQNIVEKPASKKKKKYSHDKDDDKTNKCCLLSCVKRTDSKCCCGIVVGCKKCNKGNNHNESSDMASATDTKQLENVVKEKSESSRTDSKSPSCFNFLKDRKRKLDQDKEIVKCMEDPSNKKVKTDEHDTQSNAFKCFGYFQKSDKVDHNESPDIRDNNKEQKVTDADGNKTRDKKPPGCFGQKKKETDTGNIPKDSSKSCFPYCGSPAQKINISEIEERTDKEDSLQTKNSEGKGCHKPNCFPFMRKGKVSTVDDIETDIVNDILPVSVRSEDSKTLKVSFKDKGNLESEDTLLKRWEDATKSAKNKKGNSLNPITRDDKNKNDETNDETLQDKDESDFTVKTKSLRATQLQNEAKEKTQVKTENEDADLEIKIVKKTRSLGGSMREKKENLPKHVEHEKVNIPLTPKVSSVSKTDDAIDDDPEDAEGSDVDSLADLEEEVTWPEVGRILDTFFFLAFAGGQAFLTVVFLVPLFTGDTKNSES